MAGIVGPVGLATLRQWSTKQAILDLSEKIEDSQFNLEQWLNRRYSDPLKKTILRN